MHIYLYTHIFFLYTYTEVTHWLYRNALHASMLYKRIKNQLDVDAIAQHKQTNACNKNANVRKLKRVNALTRQHSLENDQTRHA